MVGKVELRIEKLEERVAYIEKMLEKIRIGSKPEEPKVGEHGNCKGKGKLR
jgi:hypothetical protein